MLNSENESTDEEHSVNSDHRKNDVTIDGVDINNDNIFVTTNSHARKDMSKRVKTMIDEFNGYCQQVPTLGFNSGKYDINLLRSKLITHLDMCKGKG